MSLTVTAVPPGASSLTLRSAYYFYRPDSDTKIEYLLRRFRSTPTASASHGAERMTVQSPPLLSGRPTE